MYKIGLVILCYILVGCIQIGLTLPNRRLSMLYYYYINCCKCNGATYYLLIRHIIIIVVDITRGSWPCMHAFRFMVGCQRWCNVGLWSVANHRSADVILTFSCQPISNVKPSNISTLPQRWLDVGFPTATLPTIANVGPT